MAKEARQATTLIDSREIQGLHEQSKALFGEPFERNFIPPMPLPTNRDEEELLGVEYVYAQSTFSSKEFYIKKGMSLL